MDRITKSLLEEFSKEHGLTMVEERAQFEHFASYLTVTRYLADTFDTSDVVVGDGGDTGIDGIAIVVNGSLVTDVDAIQDMAERNGYLEVTFVFIQAERSPNFDTMKVGQIAFGVGDFFSDAPQLVRNDGVANAAAIATAIYEKGTLFKKGNPSCRVFYVTTGKWVDDQNLKARISGAVSDLKELDLFKDVEFTPVDAADIQKRYNQTKNAISREFAFSVRTPMPEIPGITEAYVGVITATEFLKLISDRDGTLVRSVFYDNVRDWQDYNVVNAGIRDTLESPMRSRFALMNNGVTVVAKTVRPTGTRLFIEDYQIVNGCQTSHVLYDHRDQLDDAVLIPIRVIATQDEEIITAITKATNSQTQVRPDQLLALTQFQKRLEVFFSTFNNGKKLYFERRSCQYNSIPGIEKTRVVTRDNLIRSFASVFLEEPHRTARDFGSLLQSVGTRVFADNHQLEPYYLSALALYRLEYLFRNQTLETKYKPARYHVLTAFRYVASKTTQIPQIGSNEMKRYCQPLMELLWDTAKAAETFKTTISEVIDRALSGNFDRDYIRTSSFTDLVKQYGKEFIATQS